MKTKVTEGKLTCLDFTLEPQTQGQQVAVLGSEEEEDDAQDAVGEGLFVKEEALSNLTHRRQHFRLFTKDGNGTAETVKGYLRMTSVILMLGVLLVFALFVSRYKRFLKAPNSSKQSAVRV
jgi:uncharacterized membrane protein